MLEREALKTKYSNEFLKGLMGNPDLIRNVAVVGHLHHGKTLVRPGALARCARPGLWRRRGDGVAVAAVAPNPRRKRRRAGNIGVAFPFGREGS